MAVAIDGLQVANEFLNIVDVIVQMEFTIGQRHQACVFPIGDVDLVALQHGLDSVAQQGGVVARQGSHDQHHRLGLERGQGVRIVREAFETAQFAKRLVDFDALMNCHIDPIDLDGLDAKFRLFIIFAQPVHQRIACRHALCQRRLGHGVQRIAVKLCCSLGQIGKWLHDRALGFKNLIQHVTVFLATK